jgi:cell fate (sporulation/competence/biofilm development) regulator YlbF (YheA/YmcA/DUF963 family)
MSSDPDSEPSEAAEEAPLGGAVATSRADIDVNADANAHTHTRPRADGDSDGDATPEALARQLGVAIAETDAYEAFAEAKAAVEADEEVQAAIADFERQRSQYVFDEQTGRADESDLAALKEAQRDLHAMPTMRTYLRAQERLSERLSAINEALSADLAVDFAGEAGGCCQD